MPVVILAADPGPTTGFCLLRLERGYDDDSPFKDSPLRITERLIYACNSLAAYGLAEYLVESNEGPAQIVAAGEEFREGTGAGARGHEAAVTRSVIADLSSLPLDWIWRPAATVKPWSTDVRLAKAGLLDITVKSVDARDAARIALFSATHDCGLPDPLSRRRSK